jgi:hypothetical protein
LAAPITFAVVSRVTKATLVYILDACLGEVFGECGLGEPAPSTDGIQADIH